MNAKEKEIYRFLISDQDDRDYWINEAQEIFDAHDGVHPNKAIQRTCSDMEKEIQYQCLEVGMEVEQETLAEVARLIVDEAIDMEMELEEWAAI